MRGRTWVNPCLSADGTTSAPSLSPSINPGYSTQGFAESQPRQLAPSVGRTRAGLNVSAAPISIDNSDQIASTSTRTSSSTTAAASRVPPRRFNLHRQRRLDRIDSDVFDFVEQTAAAFYADARAIQSGGGVPYNKHHHQRRQPDQQAGQIASGRYVQGHHQQGGGRLPMC